MTQNSGVGGPLYACDPQVLVHWALCAWIWQQEEGRAAVAARGKDSIRGLPCGQGFSLQGKTLELSQVQLRPMNRPGHVKSS